MKEFLKDKKIFTMVAIVSLIVVSIIFICLMLATGIDDRNMITYDEIANVVNNKNSILIYYYNSNSSNHYNKEVLKDLDKKRIKYYIYDDKNVMNEEKNKFLDLLNIKKETFGFPSLIYIKNGEMYGNLINIDNMDVVDKFIKNYDLYVLK